MDNGEYFMFSPYFYDDVAQKSTEHEIVSADENISIMTNVFSSKRSPQNPSKPPVVRMVKFALKIQTDLQKNIIKEILFLCSTKNE